MTKSILRSVRFAFVTLLLGLTTYTVIESTLGGRQAGAQAAAEGLSTCGTEEQPCALEAVAVVAEAAPAASVPATADEGLASCGSQAHPCVLEPVAVEAERRTERLASADLPRMMVRVGS